MGVTGRITVRVDEDEEEWIIKKAGEVGVSKSRYMRQVTLGERPPAKVPFATNQRSLELDDNVTHGEVKELIHKGLPAVGRNVDQIVKKVNSKDEFAEKEREELITEIKACRKSLDRLAIKFMEAIL
ncbi:hypothetical protein SAMN05443144_1046 [Fodinibius roseus]|uniref:Uncharacterized protein n=1 Tax=Fodinibius roseus TaxID=1194090 RepID=A0A1M4X2W5_9BACT|nr:hypothetical protein [Fodinibius roseus]SHE87836.1 hypothetical protein SAMN05443144_1046 [Fodinibius roseus]